MAAPIPPPEDVPLVRKEAARFLTERGYKIAAQTLARFAVEGGGPKFLRFGTRVIYLPSDLLTWAASRTRVHTSTSDPGRPLGDLA